VSPTAPPSISIVLPVYNGEHYLRRCLDSVFAQTHREFELVAADDGSSDGSAALLASSADPRLRVLPAIGWRGLFGNLNRLIGEARAPIVKILCQDDELTPDCLAEVTRFFGKHPEVGMLFHKTVVVDAGGATLREDSTEDLPDTLPPRLAQQHFFFHGCIPGNLSTVAFRASAFVEAGGFDASFEVSGDYDLWVRLCGKRPLGVLQRRLLRLRLHAGQLSRARASGVRFIRENRRIRRTIAAGLSPELRERANRFEKKRHCVLDWHYAVRAALALRPAEFARVVCALGLGDAFWGMWFWLVTLNNRRRPAPPFDL